ncbi:PIPO, partial [Yam mosaic virus]|uniref:PIPO n=1 Tax=Yam mosaic virus TaxID=41460 RepID=UPI0002651313
KLCGSFGAGVERTKLVGKMLFNMAVAKTCLAIFHYISPSKNRRFRRQVQRIGFLCTWKDG